MEAKDKETSLVNALLKTHEDNVRLKDLLERQVNATERIAHHLDTSIPAIMAALGAVREDTASFKREDTPTAIRVWDRFAAAPARVQWLAVGLIIAVALSGWAGHVVEWISGK